MHVEIAPLIAKYGYIATFAGSLIEGETMLILSGLAAHRGYLDFLLVVAAGALGGALGDLGYFLLGRHCSGWLLARFPKLAPGIQRVRGMIEAHPKATIFGVRFLYGLRTVGPIAIGSTRVPLLDFVLMNAVGALAWSACWAGVGFVLGRAAERLLGEMAHYEGYFFAGILLVGGVVALGFAFRRRVRASH